MRVSGPRGLAGLAFVLLIMAITGCGGGGGGGGSNVAPIPINSAPTITRVTPSQSTVVLDVQSVQSMDFTIKADDPDGGDLTCFWTWDSGYADPEQSTVAAGSNSTATFTPPDYDYQCTLRATVSDGEMDASVSWQVQVTGHDAGPNGKLRITGITVTPDPAEPSSAASVTASVDNPGGNPLTYTWRTKYGTFSGSGSSVAWNTPANAGAYGIYLAVSDGTATASYGKAVTVAGPSGGLLGEYFSTQRYKNVVQFDDLVLSRVDPNVNFHWEKLSPDPASLGGDGWGARWTGFVRCEQAGTYVFRAYVDDGARMRIQDDGGQWVWVIPDTTENWSDHTEGEWLPGTTVPLVLQGGKWYPIQLEYFEGGGDAFVELYWSTNSGSEEVIPQSYLRPPS